MCSESRSIRHILSLLKLSSFFERNTSCKSEFSRWRKAHLIQIGLFSYDEEKHASLEKKPFVLDAGATSTLFSCENTLSFLKEHC